jgi:hypothetical protein
MAQTQGVVIAPGSVVSQQQAGQNPVESQGGYGEQIVSELHGKWYTATRGGLVFTAAATAAITLPITSAALVSKFCLINPLGSGKVMELIDADFASVSATEVVNAIQLVYQTTPGGVTGLASTTAGTILSSMLGSSAPASTSVATYYVAATHTGTPVVYGSLWDVSATAAGISSTHYEFDGKILVYPGCIIDLATSTAGLTNWVGQLRWAEFAP